MHLWAYIVLVCSRYRCHIMVYRVFVLPMFVFKVSRVIFVNILYLKI